MKPGRALVTGSEGFVGRHFAADLVARGWDVLGVDIRPPEPAVGHAHYTLDVRDFLRSDGLASDPFDLVIHCAAIVGGRLTIENEPLAVATDLAIDSDLFQWAVRAQPGRVLYFSSSAAYPTHLQEYPGARLVPGPRRLREDDIGTGDYIGRPDQSYGWVKLTGEYLAQMARDKGVPVTVVRPFSGYGADQALDYPFPSIVDRALHREQPLTVWGSSATVRDWIHVDDIVAACWAIMDAWTEDPVNLGTGRATSFATLARAAANAVGYDCSIEADESKPTGVAWRVADVERMFGYYRPEVTLEEGIRRAVEASS